MKSYVIIWGFSDAIWCQNKDIKEFYILVQNSNHFVDKSHTDPCNNLVLCLYDLSFAFNQTTISSDKCTQKNKHTYTHTLTVIAGERSKEKRSELDTYNLHSKGFNLDYPPGLQLLKSLPLYICNSNENLFVTNDSEPSI